MISGGWAYIVGAYGAAVSALLALTLVVTLRLARWSKRARELEKRRS